MGKPSDPPGYSQATLAFASAAQLKEGARAAKRAKLLLLVSLAPRETRTKKEESATGGVALSEKRDECRRHRGHDSQDISTLGFAMSTDAS